MVRARVLLCVALIAAVATALPVWPGSPSDVTNMNRVEEVELWTGKQTVSSAWPKFAALYYTEDETGVESVNEEYGFSVQVQALRMVQGFATSGTVGDVIDEVSNDGTGYLSHSLQAYPGDPGSAMEYFVCDNSWHTGDGYSWCDAGESFDPGYEGQFWGMDHDFSDHSMVRLNRGSSSADFISQMSVFSTTQNDRECFPTQEDQVLSVSTSFGLLFGDGGVSDRCPSPRFRVNLGVGLANTNAGTPFFDFDTVSSLDPMLQLVVNVSWSIPSGPSNLRMRSNYVDDFEGRDETLAGTQYFSVQPDDDQLACTESGESSDCQPRLPMLVARMIDQDSTQYGGSSFSRFVFDDSSPWQLVWDESNTLSNSKGDVVEFDDGNHGSATIVYSIPTDPSYTGHAGNRVGGHFAGLRFDISPASTTLASYWVTMILAAVALMMVYQ